VPDNRCNVDLFMVCEKWCLLEWALYDYYKGFMQELVWHVDVRN